MPLQQAHEPRGDFRGGIGFVALSPDRRMKAIHNLGADKFDLYRHGSPSPLSLKVVSSSGKIKGAAFGEGGQMLVCGGDDGFMHIFDLKPVGAVERESLTLSSDCSTVYALTTCTTKEYHLIAGGGSAMPAAIYIYKKPTELKQARDRSDAVEREMKAAEALQTAKDEAKAAEKVKAAQDAKARHEAEAVELNHYLKYGESEIGAFFLVFLCLIFWWAQGYLEGTEIWLFAFGSRLMFSVVLVGCVLEERCAPVEKELGMYYVYHIIACTLPILMTQVPFVSNTEYQKAAFSIARGSIVRRFIQAIHLLV
ncbi:hypothetical protein B0H12DRAFT_1069835 [Mycena haematopus]|nr:hypothetical protein B0H12DRAFT_1072888 [Mycena haematopus]KAJ7260402.1 hypothetical protein B0H12DRAFT_1069835 [Mycena haematopus]